MKIKYVCSGDITSGKSFGTFLKQCYFCGKVTPRICSIDGETHTENGREFRVCRKCQKEGNEDGS